MKMHRLAGPLMAGTVLAGCSGTGVPTSQTYVPANLIETANYEYQPPRTQEEPVRLRGALAVAEGLKNSYVVPTNLDVDGTTWTIGDVDPRKVYRVPTAPLSPTTILLPAPETLTNAVSGADQDFTIATGTSGNRAAITVMPNCAHPQSQRFDTVGAVDGYAEDKPPLQPCTTSRNKATFLTSGGVYNFEFQVNDYTAVTLVEVNHAPPPRTATGPEVPFPDGRADLLKLVEDGEYPVPWTPTWAWADPRKLVVRFNAPLPTWPTLLVGKEGEQVVNYRVIEEDGAVYFVTDRRVTEAQLRIEDEVVRITAERPRQQRRVVQGRT